MSGQVSEWGIDVDDISYLLTLIIPFLFISVSVNLL